MRARRFFQLQPLRLILLFLVCGVAANQAFANDVPGEWHFGSYCSGCADIHAASGGAGIQAALAQFESRNVCSNYTPTNGQVEDVVYSDYNQYHQVSFKLSCAANGFFGYNGGGRILKAGACPDGSPPTEGECPAACDTSDAGREYRYVNTQGTLPANQCTTGSNCKATKGKFFSSGSWEIATYTVTDQGCGGGDPETAENEENNNCVASGGTTVCMDSDSDGDCGTVNGERVCFNNVPDNGCVFTPGGKAVCDGGANSEPPDLSVNASGNNVDLYGDGLDGSGGDQEGTDDDGGGSFGGNGNGNGDGEGTDECENDACVGGVPGLDEVDSFGSLFGAFYDRVEQSPLLAATTGIAGSLPAGSCTPVSSDPIGALGNVPLTMSAHCDLWPTVSPVLFGVMLAVWSLLGVMIVLRA